MGRNAQNMCKMEAAENYMLYWAEVDMPNPVTSLEKQRARCDGQYIGGVSFLGLPFNIASYSMLIHMMAQQLDLAPGEFIWTGGDCHLYLNHLEQADRQLTREPRPLPRLELTRRPDSLFDYRYEDFAIRDYDPHPAIKAPIAV